MYRMPIVKMNILASKQNYLSRFETVVRLLLK